MKITGVETIPVSVPIRPELAIRGSLGAHTCSPFVLLKIRTDEGITGLGEVSCTPVWSGEDQITAIHTIRSFLEPAILGEDPTAIERLTVKLRRAVAANPFTKSGIEMALWDILGKLACMPLYKLLGGPVRDSVPIKLSISGAEPARAAQIAEWGLGKGFRAFKVKVGLDPDGDVARVAAVRQAIGPGIRLGVDANGGWKPRVAIQTIRRMYPFQIWFAEQPVAPVDISWMTEVRRQIEVPVMADESLYTPQDAMALARAGAADIFSVYVGKGGGIGPARKIANVAEAAGLACTVGSNLEMGIASAAMIHLAMATPGIDAEEFPCDILGHFFYEDELLTEPLPIGGGQARPHELPGLGVELDDRKVEQYRTQ